MPLVDMRVTQTVLIFVSSFVFVYSQLTLSLRYHAAKEEPVE